MKRFLKLLKFVASAKNPALTQAAYFGWNDLLSKAVSPQAYARQQRIDEMKRLYTLGKPKPKVRYRAKNCRRSTRGPNMVFC